VKHVVVALSGASGIRYGVRVLRVLHELGVRVTVAVTTGGARVSEIEEGLVVDPEAPDVRTLLGLAPDADVPETVRSVALSDIAAGVCSGTHPVDGMILVPCSMGTLARVAAGTSSNVVERSADVMLKEGRPLVLVPRETPLSRIHLENMLRVHDAGGAIVPAAPGFYHRPESIDDLVDQVVTKALDRLGVPSELIRRWKAPRE
jgi:4-hydroxy-3-polyprenylbenzoate decarboxylase